MGWASYRRWPPTSLRDSPDHLNIGASCCWVDGGVPCWGGGGGVVLKYKSPFPKVAPLNPDAAPTRLFCCYPPDRPLVPSRAADLHRDSAPSSAIPAAVAPGTQYEPAEFPIRPSRTRLLLITHDLADTSGKPDADCTSGYADVKRWHLHGAGRMAIPGPTFAAFYLHAVQSTLETKVMVPPPKDISTIVLLALRHVGDERMPRLFRRDGKPGSRSMPPLDAREVCTGVAHNITAVSNTCLPHDIGRCCRGDRCPPSPHPPCVGGQGTRIKGRGTQARQ